MINTCLLNLQVTDPMNISKPDSSFAFVREFILLGFLWVEDSEPPLLTLPYNICSHHNREWGQYLCFMVWPATPHPHVHIPGEFSFLEIWYVSSTVPKMLVNFLSDKKTISFVGCFTVLFLFFLGTTECLHLTVMAFDRYPAICRPLHYPNIMTDISVPNWSLSAGSVISVVHDPHCSYFGCPSVDQISLTMLCVTQGHCSHWHVSLPQTELLCYSLSSIVIFGNFLFILGSYTLVLTAVLHMPSATGRQKAFSTCGSHLVVVSSCSMALSWSYVSPGPRHSAGMQKVATLFYAMVTPLSIPLSIAWIRR